MRWCPCTWRSLGARTCGGTETWRDIRVRSASGSHIPSSTADVVWLKYASGLILALYATASPSTVCGSSKARTPANGRLQRPLRSSPSV